MDYSSISQDPDHPTGASPWASPRATEPAYPPSSTSDIPPSPLPPQHQSPYEADGSSQPGEAVDSRAPGEGDIGSPSLSEQVQNTHIGETGQPGEQQARSQVPARYQGTRQNARQPAPVYKIQAKITGLERTGKKDPILRFDVHVSRISHVTAALVPALLTPRHQTNIPKFRTTQYRDVRRTHAEFIKLAEHLMSANPEALVPAMPPPLTPAGAVTDEDEFRVKTSMQRWLNCILTNEVLIQDDEIVLFVESDFGYSPVVRMKQPATGVRRKYLKQFAPPPDDTPELQNARPVVKMFYLGSMDSSHKVDRIVRARRGTLQSLHPLH